MKKSGADSLPLDKVVEVRLTVQTPRGRTEGGARPRVSSLRCPRTTTTEREKLKRKRDDKDSRSPLRVLHSDDLDSIRGEDARHVLRRDEDELGRVCRLGGLHLLQVRESIGPKGRQRGR
jgi:hypothetical protein